MRKIILLFTAVLSAPLCGAVSQNKISMVTYFPVPYVAYNQINVSNQMDVGLDSNVCKLDLGWSQLAVRPLAVDRVHVQKGNLVLNIGEGNGIVNLHGDDYDGNVAVNLGYGHTGLTDQDPGQGDRPGIAEIAFTNLRAREIANPEGSLSAHIVNVENFQLFGKDFPNCREITEDGQMFWMDLALDPNHADVSKPYLVCGGPCPQERKPRDGNDDCTTTDLRILVGGMSEEQIAENGWSDFFTWNGSSWSVNAGVGACGTKTVTYACNPSQASEEPNYGWYQVPGDVSGCVPFKQTLIYDYDCSDWGRVGLPAPWEATGLPGSYSGISKKTKTVACVNDDPEHPRYRVASETWDHSQCLEWYWSPMTDREASDRGHSDGATEYMKVAGNDRYYIHSENSEPPNRGGGDTVNWAVFEPDWALIIGCGETMLTEAAGNSFCDRRWDPWSGCTTYSLHECRMGAPDGYIAEEERMGSHYCATEKWDIIDACNPLVLIPLLHKEEFNYYACKMTWYKCSSRPVSQ